MVVVPFAHPFDEARFEIPAIPPVPAARIQLEKNPWVADATSKPIGRAQRVRFQAIGTLDRSTMARPSHTQGLGRRQHRSRELRDVLEVEHSPVVTRSLPIRHDGEGVRDSWLYDDTTPRGGCPAQVCPIPMDVSIGQDDPLLQDILRAGACLLFVETTRAGSLHRGMQYLLRESPLQLGKWLLHRTGPLVLGLAAVRIQKAGKDVPWQNIRERTREACR